MRKEQKGKKRREKENTTSKKLRRKERKWEVGVVWGKGWLKIRRRPVRE